MDLSVALSVLNYVFNTNQVQIDPLVIEKQVVMARYDALENKLTNESLSWNDYINQFSVVITPTKTYKTANGAFCREYKEVINNNGEVTSREGLACREKKDYWPNKVLVSDYYKQG